MNIFFIRLALRSIFRKKGFTAINLLGLSLGLAASLYIVTFLLQEYSYDKSYTNPENIYRGILEYQFGENTKKSAFCPAQAGPDIFDAVPEITNFTRISEKATETVKYENTFYQIENTCAADEHFFEFLGHKLIIGNPKEVLANPNQIVLSETEAKRFFKNENPVGKSFQRRNGVLLTVSGVFKDFPINSSLKSNAIYSYKTMEQDKNVYLGWNGGETFLTLFRLNKGITADAANPKIQQVLDVKINPDFEKAGWKMGMTLQKMADTHLTTNIDFDLDSNRDKGFLLLICLVGIIILLLAVVNYLNLTSALAGERGKQVGIQKLSGAVQSKIILQGFAEAILTTVFASLISLVIIGLAAPYLDALLKTEVEFEPVRTGLILLSAVVITGVLSGIYPSVVLARKNILSAFKQNDFKGNRQPLRNVLVIFQFGIAVVFIIALLTVNRQLTYLLNQNMGFNGTNVLQLEMQNEYEDSQLAVLKKEINALSEVEKTSYSSQPVGDNITMNGYSVEGSENSQMLNTLYTDADFLDFYSIELLEGRNFYDSPESDQSAILVNQSFLNQQNWDSWLGKKLGRSGKKEIIGVVRDFNFAPLTTAIKPLIIVKNPKADNWEYHCLNIRISTADIESSINKIETIWAKFEPNAPLQIQFLEDRLDKAYSDIATYRKIVMLFSILAVFIACMGLLGLTAYMNRLRIKEIGIRKVNGASLAELLAMLMKDFAKWVVIALFLAIPLSWYLLNYWLQTFAYKTELSWWIFALAGLLTLGIALLTVSFQSWKAAIKNPVESLRYE